MNDINSDAFDLENLRLTIRPDVSISFRKEQRSTVCLLIQETNSQFFSVGLPEYRFINYLDGHNTLSDAVRALASQNALEDNDEFTQASAISTAQWLLENDLAIVQKLDESGRISNAVSQTFSREATSRQKKAEGLGNANPIFIRLPLGDPNSFFRRVSPGLSWLTKIWFLIVYLFAVAWAAFVFLMEGDRLIHVTSQTWTTSMFVWSFITFVGLKVIHEVAHGVFCTVNGGRVRECGLLLILFFPIPYVDVTDAWKLESKWRRISISAAGMYVESFIAAIALIGWSFVASPDIQVGLLQIFLIGSVTTLVFNANFLMRFDGYYILSDLLEIPNLAGRGQRYLAALSKKLLFGIESDRKMTERATTIIYGVAATLWRIVVYVSITWLASEMFFGFGVLIAAVGLLFWIATPVYRFLSDLKTGREQLNPNWIITVSVPAIIGILLTLFVVPFPFSTSAPAIIRYTADETVRANVTGQVDSISVIDGDYVNKGDILLTLKNPSLINEKTKLELKLKESQIIARRNQARGHIAAYHAELERQRSIEVELAEIASKVSQLSVVAPISGTVMNPSISELGGTFVNRGQELVRIVDLSSREIEFYIHQDDLPEFAGRQDHVGFVSASHPQTVGGSIVSIAPTATQYAPAAMLVTGGGPLGIRSPQDSADNPKLIVPRFKAQLQSSQPIEIPAGVRGVVRTSNSTISIGDVLFRKVNSLFSRRQ